MFAMPATPAIPAMTAVVRLFNFITTLLINHRAFLLTADLVPLERLCPALVSSEVRQQRTHATTKESLTQSLRPTRSKPAKNRAALRCFVLGGTAVARLLLAPFYATDRHQSQVESGSMRRRLFRRGARRRTLRQVVPLAVGPDPALPQQRHRLHVLPHPGAHVHAECSLQLQRAGIRIVALAVDVGDRLPMDRAVVHVGGILLARLGCPRPWSEVVVGFLGL